MVSRTSLVGLGASNKLHRHIESSIKAVGMPVPEDDKVEVLRDVYKTLYRKFKARAWNLLSSRELSDWGIVFSMQHHGIPTADPSTASCVE